MMSMVMAAALAVSELTAPGPKGPLKGEVMTAGKGAPVVVIIPGSGPTDRDGNSPLGITAASYRLLAERLGAQGVTTLRVDKRGMFGSKAAIDDPNKVTIGDYAADAHAWARAARAATGARCVWLAGHSEGGLVALKAGQDRRDLCGIVTIAVPGRKLGDVIREQFRSNPANAPILAPAIAALDSLDAGKPVPVSALPGPLAMVFPPAVQPFLIDAMAQDPRALARSLTLPLLIVNGDKDLQTPAADAVGLAKAQPRAKLVVVPGVNHVLKTVAGEDRAANLAAYADPSLPVSPAVVDAIAAFVKTKR